MINEVFKSLIVLLVLFFNTTVSKAQKRDAIVGTWISVQRNVMVEISADSPFYKAKVVWFKDTDDKTRPMDTRTDIKNPDKSLRSRKVLGLDVLRDLRFDPKCKCWENGMIYDVLTGRTWNASISLDDLNNMKVRGFWHYEFIGRSMFFLRVKY